MQFKRNAFKSVHSFKTWTAMPAKTGVPSRVVVHPIVLLSVVDHFNRLSRIGNQRRVVGVLLGSWRKGNVVDIATSFAGEWAPPPPQEPVFSSLHKIMLINCPDHLSYEYCIQ